MKKYIFMSIILVLISSISAQDITGDGLTGHYYQGYAKIEGIITFDNLNEAFSRVDTLIDFWNGSSGYRWQPVAGYGDNYSVLWQGFIYIEETGAYGFGTISDDGSQIFIDDSLIVDNSESQWYDWEDNMGEADTSGAPYAPFILERGYHKITVAFFENASYDGIELWWITPSEIDSSDIPWYGKNFHSTPPVFNAGTNWQLVPKSVLFTSHNFAPLAQTDTLKVYEDSLITFDPLVNDHDPDSNLVILTGHDTPQFGHLQMTDSTLTYLPDANYFGPDSFHYYISDSLNAVDTGLVVIEVIGINDAPDSFSLLSPANNTVLDSLSGELKFTWTASGDVDGDPLNYFLNIFNTLQDTLITVSQDSFYIFNGVNFFQPETDYDWTVGVSDGTVTVFADSFRFSTPELTSIPTRQELPRHYTLLQNYPNPFNPSTTIEFTLPRSEFTTLKIYSILGSEVATLVSDRLQAGVHRYQIDGSNLATGIYYYRLTAGEFTSVRKMILLR